MNVQNLYKFYFAHFTCSLKQKNKKKGTMIKRKGKGENGEGNGCKNLNKLYIIFPFYRFVVSSIYNVELPLIAFGYHSEGFFERKAERTGGGRGREGVILKGGG